MMIKAETPISRVWDAQVHNTSDRGSALKGEGEGRRQRERRRVHDVNEAPSTSYTLSLSLRSLPDSLLSLVLCVSVGVASQLNGQFCVPTRRTSQRSGTARNNPSSILQVSRSHHILQ